MKKKNILFTIFILLISMFMFNNRVCAVTSSETPIGYLDISIRDSVDNDLIIDETVTVLINGESFLFTGSDTKKIYAYGNYNVELISDVEGYTLYGGTENKEKLVIFNGSDTGKTKEVIFYLKKDAGNNTR